MKDFIWEKGRKTYVRKCNHCKKDYKGSGRLYCSKKCMLSSRWKTGDFKGASGKFREKSPAWRGGRAVRNGYVFLNIGNGKYLGEHRVVMEKHLKRKLEVWEEVHHKNTKKDDNRIENLQLVVKKYHFGMVRCPHCLEEFLIK